MRGSALSTWNWGHISSPAPIAPRPPMPYGLCPRAPRPGPLPRPVPRCCRDLPRCRGQIRLPVQPLPCRRAPALPRSQVQVFPIFDRAVFLTCSDLTAETGRAQPHSRGSVVTRGRPASVWVFLSSIEPALRLVCAPRSAVRPPPCLGMDFVPVPGAAAAAPRGAPFRARPRSLVVVGLLVSLFQCSPSLPLLAPPLSVASSLPPFPSALSCPACVPAACSFSGKCWSARR